MTFLRIAALLSSLAALQSCAPTTPHSTSANISGDLGVRYESSSLSNVRPIHTR